MPRNRPAERDGRRTALRILDAVDAGRGASHALLAAMPGTLDDRDRALATEIVYGVLRRRLDLDRLVVAGAGRPLRRIDPSLRNVLRVALYQVLFLSRVPRSAAVHEAVEMARESGREPAASFANAVLRSACRFLDRGGSGRPGAATAQDAVTHLRETHSFPRFLVERFLERYGREECEALLGTMNRPAPLVLRVVRRGGSPGAVAERLRREGVECVPSPLLPQALRVIHGVPQRTAAFREGTFYIQDEASQMVALLLDPIGEDDDLIDLCAAPGGKLFAAAEARPAGHGLLVAADRDPARLGAVRENALRLGVEGILAVAMDATRPALRGSFRRILLDAACSGTGIIRRHPEIRWRRSRKDIVAFSGQQALALQQAVRLLASGGRLVYAVCSLEPEEGPERVEAVLRSETGLSIVDARGLLPAPARGLVDERGFLMTLPHRHDVDGFFAAALERG